MTETEMKSREKLINIARNTQRVYELAYELATAPKLPEPVATQEEQDLLVVVEENATALMMLMEALNKLAALETRTTSIEGAVTAKEHMMWQPQT